MLGEITALQHELRNDTVESTSLVSESFLAGAQSAEIVAVFGTTSSKSLNLIVPAGSAEFQTSGELLM
jgi:hypothetical protein